LAFELARCCEASEPGANNDDVGLLTLRRRVLILRAGNRGSEAADRSG
jgi:hypothetical protein